MRKPDLFDEETLREIAIDVYENKKSQKDIAKALGVARASITAALNRAIAMGIVRVTVDPEPRPLRLPKIRRDLKIEFKLEDVILVPAHLDTEGRPTPDIIPDITRAAATYLNSVAHV